MESQFLQLLKKKAGTCGLLQRNPARETVNFKLPVCHLLKSSLYLAAAVFLKRGGRVCVVRYVQDFFLFFFVGGVNQNAIRKLLRGYSF